MNKYGKGNVIFIILIPVFMVISLIVIDTVLSYNQEKAFKKVTEKVISETVSDNYLDYDEYYERMKRLYELYGYETEMLLVDANEYQIYVENEHLYVGIFSSLFGSGKEEIVKLFGILDFKLKKGSKVSLKVEARLDEENDNKLEFEYIKSEE